MSVFEKPIFVIYIPRDLSDSIDQLQESLEHKLKGYEVVIIWDANADFDYKCEVVNGTMWSTFIGIIRGLLIENKVKNEINI